MNSHLILKHPVEGRNAWVRNTIINEEWVYELPKLLINDLLNIIKPLKKSSCLLKTIDELHFTPGLSSLLNKVLNELENGKGFVIIKGLCPKIYDEETLLLIYWVIGNYLGDIVTQNSRGEMLCEVSDYKLGGLKNNNVRGYQTNEALKFHTDSSDIVGLLCIHPAKTGGISQLASSMSIYNELLENYREYIGVYYNGVFYDIRSDKILKNLGAYRNPIYGYFKKKLSCRYYLRDFAESAQCKTGIPLTSIEIEALDLFEKIANRQQMHLNVKLEPGDMQFLNNNIIVHARTEYTDHDEDYLKRKLFRLWLNPKNKRYFSPNFAINRDGFFIG